MVKLKRIPMNFPTFTKNKRKAAVLYSLIHTLQTVKTIKNILCTVCQQPLRKLKTSSIVQYRFITIIPKLILKMEAACFPETVTLLYCNYMLSEPQGIGERVRLCKLWGFHTGVPNDYGLLACDASSYTWRLEYQFLPSLG